MMAVLWVGFVEEESVIKYDSCVIGGGGETFTSSHDTAGDVVGGGGRGKRFLPL